MICLTRFLVIFAVVLTVSGQSIAREVIVLTNEFRILRDFSEMKIAGQDAKAVRVFIDTDRFIVDTISAAENTELQQIAIDGLSSKLQVVKTKNEANYLVQIRMYQSPDYAIRNPRQEFSRGLVLVSLCKYPIKDQAVDCGSLTYFYFQEYEAKAVFSSIFRAWLKQTIIE
jgi:hypothetical protein